jgi:hypothetical protein
LIDRNFAERVELSQGDHSEIRRDEGDVAITWLFFF